MLCRSQSATAPRFFDRPRSDALNPTFTAQAWLDAQAAKHSRWDANALDGCTLQALRWQRFGLPFHALSTGTGARCMVLHWLRAPLTLIDDPIAGLDKPSVTYLAQALNSCADEHERLSWWLPTMRLAQEYGGHTGWIWLSRRLVGVPRCRASASGRLAVTNAHSARPVEACKSRAVQRWWPSRGCAPSPASVTAFFAARPGCHAGFPCPPFFHVFLVCRESQQGLRLRWWFVPQLLLSAAAAGAWWWKQQPGTRGRHLLGARGPARWPVQRGRGRPAGVRWRKCAAPGCTRDGQRHGTMSVPPLRRATAAVRAKASGELTSIKLAGR